MDNNSKEDSKEGAEGPPKEIDPGVRPRPFAPRVFKKCKSATFTLDGTSYTIGKFLADNILNE